MHPLNNFRSGWRTVQEFYLEHFRNITAVDYDSAHYLSNYLMAAQVYLKRWESQSRQCSILVSPLEVTDKGYIPSSDMDILAFMWSYFVKRLLSPACIYCISPAKEGKTHRSPGNQWQTHFPILDSLSSLAETVHSLCRHLPTYMLLLTLMATPLTFYSLTYALFAASPAIIFFFLITTLFVSLSPHLPPPFPSIA